MAINVIAKRNKPARKAKIGNPFVPDDGLIHQFSTRHRLNSEVLSAALSAFGPLPIEAQKEMILALIRVYSDFQSFNSAYTITVSQARKRLIQTANASCRLLRSVGIDPAPASFWERMAESSPSERLARLGRPTSIGGKRVKPDSDGDVARFWMVCADVERAGKQIAQIDDALAEQRDLFADAIEKVLWLHRRATTAQAALHKLSAKGRGGVRNRLTPKGAMIRQAINVYAAMRERFPESGNAPAKGGPMLRFIQATAKLVGANVAETEAAEVWRVRKRDSKSE